jgi:hypothetical protein
LDFPADLHTGYFNIQYSSQFPLDGCPPGGPPPGFQDCHSVLNKDGPKTSRGSQRVPGTNENMYDLAALLATRATTDFYVQMRDLVATTNGPDAATALFQQGGPMPNLSDLRQMFPNVFPGIG